MQNYRETWQEIALSTERIDRQQAINAVFSVYELLELPAPEIQFFDSLYAAAEVANPFYDITCFTEDGCICGTKLITKLHDHFYPEFINSIGHWDMEIESNLTVNLGIDIDSQLSESIANTLSRPRPFNYELGDDLSRTEWFLPLNWYAHKGGFFDFHFSVASNRLFQPYDERWWQAFQQLVKSCGWIIPFNEICLVCVRPTKFSFDSENRLHAEGEAAIQFTDNRGLYSYRGITLPENYGKMLPERWQPQWLLEETDEDLKLRLVQAITASSETPKRYYFQEALNMAARLGKLDILQQILATEKDNCLSLSNALADGVRSGDLKIVQILIDAGAILNYRTEGGTPLIAAAGTGDLKIVRYLVEAGADPNMWIDSDGYSSPLSTAVYWGYQEVCDYLIPLITNLEEVEYARRELPKAIIRKQRRENKQLQRFFEAVRDTDTATVRKLATTGGVNINSFDEDGRTALHSAVGWGNLKMIQLLAELGADLNLPDEGGETPLMAAIGIYGFQARSLRKLIRAGADVNYKDENGYTALSYALLNSSPEVFVKILLKAGAVCGDWNGTEIYTAATSGNVKLIKYLIAVGVDIDRPDLGDSSTALMKAANNSQARVMRVLIRAGADVNARDKNGNTALHYADLAQLKHPVIKKILLKAGGSY